MYHTSVSVVLYNSNAEVVNRIINKLEKCVNIYLIDNSPESNFKAISRGNNIKQIHIPSNPGFGVAHNFAIKEAITIGSKYHFIINPDVIFESDVISKMVDVMESDSNIGMMMPQILNLDGRIQNLPKLLPSPFSLLMRKLKKPSKYYTKFINQYELREVSKDTIYNAPVLSGCFTLLNLNAIKEVGMYDDRFFMYFEDWDLSRRMHKKYKTIYFPKVSIYHGYESGANKSISLFITFIKSAIRYFNKWGWFVDRERVAINKAALSQFKV